MREVWKKLLAVLVVVLMMTNQTVSALAYETPEGDDKETGTELVLEDLDPKSLGIRYLGEEGETPASPAEDLESLTDIVRVSIVLEDESTLEHGYSAENIAYNTQAVSYRDALKVKQDELTARIEKEIVAKLDVQWNMTLAVNIISANVKVKDIPLIENVEGVKKVVRENRYEALVDDPKTVNTSQFMVGASSAWSAGYYGAGSRIAIIDTGIDTTHQSFNADAFNHAIAEDGSSSELMTQISSTVLNSLNAKSKLSSLTAAQTYVSAKIPFGFNYVDGSTTINHINDTQGEHGSHVAGIASANRYIKNGSSYDEAISSVKAVGMAPDAQLLIMKVFGSKGGAYDSDYMVAIEDAITLGADAVNLSLGSGAPGWTYDSTYQDVLNNLSSSNNVKTVVSISAGNAGPITENLTTDLYIEDVGMHTGGSPGSFLNSLGVASADNIGETGTPLTFNGNQTVYYTETESTGAAMSSIAGSYSYVFIDAVGNTADYQAVNSAESLSGKIVIVNRGELSFYEKGNNAKSYSPKAVIVANNQAGTISMDLSDYTGTFPMVSITLSDANTIKANSTAHTTGNYTYYTGSVTVTNAMSSGLTTSRDNAIVSSFSSWGVPGSLVMKPEITAPGGSIRSVAGTNKTTSGATAGGSTAYEIMSGTSMAAPHITGLSALVAEYLRENDLSAVNSALTSKYTNRAIVQSLLMSTATPMKPNGEYLSILQQGSGLAEVSKAVSASSVIMMSEDDDTLTASTGSAADGKVKAEFGDDPKRQGEYEYSFTIYNITDTDLAYTLATDLFTQKAEDGFMSEGTEAITANVRYIYDSEGAVSHDVDKDGDTDNDDAQAILDYLTGKLPASDADLSAADLDNDGAVTSADARLLLGYEPTVQEGLIVRAGSSKKVTVKISLKNKDALDASHPNGAYIEGYTYVRCTTKGAGDGVSLEHTHSIPLLGFYGSWTDPSMFDNTSYIDTLYGTDKTPYTGNRDTNYMTVTYNGVTSKFSGNPYIVEDSFPADRLALNSSSTIGRISYNLYRAAGTTGYAVTKLDEDGQVSSVLSSIVTGNEVTGIWYSQSNAAWQNLTTKVYNVNKAPSAYGLKDGDKFRAGFYAIPEYNAMMENATMTSGTSGIVGQAGFNRILTSNVLGKGAFVGYDFTIDNVEPSIESAVLNGNTLSILASDNRNLAYVAVMSLDGTVKYAEAAPGTDTYTISLDASDAIASAHGYVAVFAGDYAGNEVAKAVRVNDNAYEDKVLYVLTDTLTAGEDYLILDRNTAGSGHALGHTNATITVNNVTVKPGSTATGGALYVDSADVANTSVWTAASGYTFKNGNYYVRQNRGSLQMSTTNSNNAWSWDAENHRLSITYSGSERYLRYYSSTFSLNTATSSVYLYKKITVRMEIDPYSASSITVTPASLDLYINTEDDLVAKVMPLTADDRTVTWTSSDTSIATVDEHGHVVAKGAGTATITAASNSNPEVYATASVKVTSVNQNLNGIVYDEEGGVYFASFNANNMPNWTKLHNDPQGLELHSAFMNTTTALYAGTLDMNTQSSVLYTVNTSTYALTEFGVNYVMAFDLARASTRYTDYFVYPFAKYLIFGNLTPVEDEEGTFSGLPYGLLDLSSTSVGDAYAAAVAVSQIGTTSSQFYFLDETGKIWRTTLSIGSSVSFGTPSLIVDTGISTSFLYQTLYYDGTYLYWGHQDGDLSELIIINPSTKAVYRAGNFGDNIWPAVGFYRPGVVGPGSTEEETEENLEPLELAKLASRDELMTEEVLARIAAESAKFSSNAPAEEPASEESGTLNNFRNAYAPVSERATVTPSAPQTGEDETVMIKEDVDVTNGFMTITYDPEKLTLQSAEPAFEKFVSVNTETAGTVKFAYARSEALPANENLLVLSFKAICEDTEITVTVKERNDDLNLNEQVTTELAGLGHAWGEPDWTWSGTSAATAAFVCANDPAHTETVNATITSVRTEPTCEADGSVVYTATVTFNGETYTDTKTETLPALGHDYELTGWHWSGYASATATFTCANDPAHTETVNAVITSVRTEPDCEADGSVVYTATVTFNGETYTDILTEVLPATGHAYEFTAWEWTGNDNDGYTAAKAVFTCANDPAHIEKVDAVLKVESTDATCTTPGEVIYTATVTFEGKTYTDSKTVDGVALGHDYELTGWAWNGYASATATFTCKNDPSHVETVNATITSVRTEPTCEAEGSIVYSAKVTFEGKDYTDTKTETLPALGHDYELTGWTWNGYESARATFTCKNDSSHTETVNATITSVRTEPTCEADGSVVYTAAVTFEGKEYNDTKTETLPALGHDYELTGWSWNGYESAKATFTCKNDAAHNETVDAVITEEIVEEATYEKEGLKRYTAAVSFEGKEYTDSKEAPYTIVTEAPVIIEHPADVTLRSGSAAAVFKVAAEGEGLSYQWYYRTSSTGTWAKSSSSCATTDTYTLPASSVVSARSGYQYRCEVTNLAGSVTSNAATLTVTTTAKPVILEHPADVTLRSGSAAAVFKVVAEGEGLSYQWYYRTSSTGTWAKSTSSCATTDTYTLPASSVVSSRNGYQYKCVVSNKGGSVTSNAATLTVTTTAKPVIIEQPKSQAVKPGTAVSFKVTAQGEGLSYQWYYRTSGTGTWAKSTSTCATTDTYTLPASSVVKARNGYEYRCVVTNKAGSVTSEAAVLTLVLADKPVITSQPQSVTVKAGTAVSFTVEATGEGLEYQWYYRTSSTGTWSKSTASCANTPTYTLEAAKVVKSRSGYEYRCLVKNEGGSVYSEAAVLTVTPAKNELRYPDLSKIWAIVK